MDTQERIIEPLSNGCSLSAVIQLVDGKATEVGYVLRVNGAIQRFTSRPAAIAAWMAAVQAAQQALNQEALDQNADEPDRGPSP